MAIPLISFQSREIDVSVDQDVHSRFFVEETLVGAKGQKREKDSETMHSASAAHGSIRGHRSQRVR